MKQFDVLSREFSVLGTYFLEASAGTGKTFAIEHFVVRLLILEERALLIEQILVMTFTRAAARELKLRIRRNIMKVAQELRLQNSSMDYVKKIIEQGDKAVQSAIKKLEEALICDDLTQIFTLHGFCFRALKSSALSARITLTPPQPEDLAHLPSLEQLVKRHLRSELKFPHFGHYQMLRLLKRYHFDMGRLIHALVLAIQSGKGVDSPPSFEVLHQQFVERLNSFPSVILSNWISDVERLLPHYKKMGSREVFAESQLIGGILEKKECSLEQFDRLLQAELFLERLTPEHRKVRAKLPPSDSFFYPGLVEKVQHDLLPLLITARDPSQIFLKIVGDLSAIFFSMMEEEELFSPDMLLLKMEQAINLPSFVEQTKGKYRALIVDEFQDTDQIQWKIIEHLFLNTVEAVCLVGDPKQSIYGFRSADVYTYFEAAKRLGENTHQRLETNFRSTPTLIKALNALFSKGKNSWMLLPSLGKDLVVPPVKWVERDEELESFVEFFIVEGKKGRSQQFPTQEMEEKKLFPFIASEILRLNSDKKVEYHEIAILIKDRFQGQRIVEHLKKWGIPAHSKRGTSLVDSPAYYAMKEILNAALFPYDLRRLKNALGSTVIGWSEHFLRKERDDPLVIEATKQLHHLHQLLITRGFGSFFQALLRSRFFDEKESVQELLLGSKELTLYFDLRTIAELLIEEETSRGLTSKQLLEHLEKLSRLSYGEKSEITTTFQEERGSVAVMTTHLSKGLEFNTVFVLGPSSRQSLAEEIVVKQGKEQVLKRLDLNDSLCSSALEESDAEKMRQLYVAMTRAKTRLYASIVVDKESPLIPFGEASPMELFLSKFCSGSDLATVSAALQELFPLVRYQVVEEVHLPPSYLPPPSIEEKLFAPPQVSLSEEFQEIYSFSSLKKGGRHVELFLTKSQEKSVHALPFGSETGQILHRVFEKILKKGAHRSNSTKKIAPIVDQEFQGSVIEGWQEVCIPWIFEILNTPIDGFSLSEVSSNSLQQEMEFYFPLKHLKNGVMKGFADLLFECHGKYYLLDWKSNVLGASDEDYSLENIAKVMELEEYGLQASIYREALMRYVKLFDNRPFKEVFGGAIYFFLRGKVPYLFFPEPLSLRSSR